MKPVQRIPYLGKDMRSEKIAPVVLVYLIGYIQNVAHVLFMRRGDKVAYMQNAWSTIAGFLAGEDLKRQALIEIAGETSLLESEVNTPELIDIFEDEDAENNKTWKRHLMTTTVIHSSTDPEGLGVRLDWEHKEAAWVPVSIVLEWLSGKDPDDPTARAILLEEGHTPDFRQNLARVTSVLEKLV